MQRYKAAGLIEKVPGGWTKGLPRKRERVVSKVLASIERTATEMEASEGHGLAGDLERATGLGLGRIKQALAYGGKKPKFDVLIKQAELGTKLLRAQMQVDESVLRGQREDRLLEIVERASQTLPPPTLEDDEADAGNSS